MTAQFTEVLTLDGQQHILCSCPLASYLALGGECPPLSVPHTALWRGYVGTWEIRAQRLYLVHLEGLLMDGSALTLETVFPGYANRVYAHWYSGTLRLPQGQLLKYVHGGFLSCYEQDLLIDVTRGQVTGQRTRFNGASDKLSAPQGWQVGALTTR